MLQGLHRNLFISSHQTQIRSFRMSAPMSNSLLSQFKKDHPMHQLMVQEFSNHTKDPKTIGAIANGTYIRPRPKTIYRKHAASLDDFFGSEWQKKAQNAVHYIMKQQNLPTQKEMIKRHGGDGKIEV